MEAVWPCNGEDNSRVLFINGILASNQFCMQDLWAVSIGNVRVGHVQYYLRPLSFKRHF